MNTEKKNRLAIIRNVSARTILGYRTKSRTAVRTR